MNPFSFAVSLPADLLLNSSAYAGPLFPGLPRTEQELRVALVESRGILRQRIIDRLTELEEEQYRNIDDIVPDADMPF